MTAEDLYTLPEDHLKYELQAGTLLNGAASGNAARPRGCDGCRLAH